MRKAIIFCLMIPLSVSLSCKPGEIGGLNCGGGLRGYQGGADKIIADYNEKIAAIEKDDETKSKSITRLGLLYGQLGAQYNEMRMWDLAIQSLEKSISYGNQNNTIFFQMGVAYANRGKDSGNRADYDSAERYYLKSLELNPKDYEASYGLAILLFYEKNNRDKAITIMEGIVESKSTFYMGRFALAKFYYETGDKQKSLSAFEKLNSDLSALPQSEGINIYLKHSRESITRIMSEMGRSQKN